jgi:hypothetical protein
MIEHIVDSSDQVAFIRRSRKRTSDAAAKPAKRPKLEGKTSVGPVTPPWQVKTAHAARLRGAQQSQIVSGHEELQSKPQSPPLTYQLPEGYEFSGMTPVQPTTSAAGDGAHPDGFQFANAIKTGGKVLKGLGGAASLGLGIATVNPVLIVGGAVSLAGSIYDAVKGSADDSSKNESALKTAYSSAPNWISGAVDIATTVAAVA